MTLEIGEFEAEVGGVMRFFLDFKLGELAAEEGGVFDFRAFLVGGEIRFLRPWGTARGDFLFLLFDFASVHCLAVQAFFISCSGKVHTFRICSLSACYSPNTDSPDPPKL